MKKIIPLILVVFLGGCSAIDKKINYGTLDVQTKMSDTIFLEPVDEHEKTIYVQIRNTSDKKDLKIRSQIVDALEMDGYKVVKSPSKAHYILQANILAVGLTKNADPFRSLNAPVGVGGALGGAAVGGLASGRGEGMLAGALIGGGIDYLADKMVQVNKYMMATDLQIQEKMDVNVKESGASVLKQGTSSVKAQSYKKNTNYSKYQTRIISVAVKTNLKFEEALPELKAGLVSSIAGTFVQN